MKNVHGIIYAYHSYPELGELCSFRTGASLPFCGRYRLIDFALSSMQNAGLHDVGIIMQRGYQSLMDHLGSGRTWDMSRRVDGMRLLPPYGLRSSTKGVYEGCMEALDAVKTYINLIKQDYVLLIRGDLVANIDLEKLIEQHMDSGCDVTAVCAKNAASQIHHRYILGESGNVEQMLSVNREEDRGYASLEVYVMKKQLLLELMQWCSERGKLHFHRDAMRHLLEIGGKMGIYIHEGYAKTIVSVNGYYQANMDMLNAEMINDLFRANVTTRERSDVSTYYGEHAKVKNSLIADGCVIEGEVENCIIFGGVKIGRDSVVKNSIIMNDTVIGSHVDLDCIISDKGIKVSDYISLKGSSALPIVIPKESAL